MSSSVRKNFAYNSAYQLLLVITPLVTTPWLSRTIGAEGNGVFTYTQSIANYFVLASMLGISNYGVREIASCGDDKLSRSRTFWEIITMSAIVGTIVFIVYTIYTLRYGKEYFAYFTIWGFWVLGSVADPSWLFFGCQEFRMPTLRSFSTRLISVIIILLFVRDSEDTWIYVLAISSSYLLNTVLIWPFVGRYVCWVRPTLHESLMRLQPNIALFIPVLATSLYTLMDKVMLGSMAGVNELGLYDYAEKISKMPMSVITALGAVVLPRMTEVIAAGKIEEGRSLVRDTMWFMLACAMALSFGIAAVAPEFVPVFFGSGYEACVPLMRALCAIIPFICATNVIGVQYLLPCRRDREFTLSVITGAVVNIAVNIIAIPVMGAMGAALATVASEVAVLVFQAWRVGRELDITRCLVSSLPFAGIGATMFILIRWIARLMGSFSCTSIGLVVEVAVGAVSYIVLAWLWCYSIKSKHLKRVLPAFARW